MYVSYYIVFESGVYGWVDLGSYYFFIAYLQNAYLHYYRQYKEEGANIFYFVYLFI